MAIDLSQFHEVFFEESFENVDIMENSLMELDPDNVDDEVVNAVFRAAHSIKGGSATFGFRAISEFTHVLETLLDQVRGGQRDLAKSDVNLFLQAADCMREMLSLLQSGEDASTELSEKALEQFNALLSGEAPELKQTAGKSDASVSHKESTDNMSSWKISFIPDKGVFRTGNDPLRLIRELALLGELECQTSVEKLPSIGDMVAEANYLGWDLVLRGELGKSQIEEIFEWVADESDLTIEQIGGEQAKPNEGSGSKPEQTFWEIEFIPEPSILRTGNDPVKLFDSLAVFGEVKSITPQLRSPEFSSMDAELCFLSWDLLLAADADAEAKILEVFDWVIDDCKLHVKAVSGIFEEGAFRNSAAIISKDEMDAPKPESTINAQSPSLELVAANGDATANTKTTENTSKKPKAATAPVKAKAAESTSIRVGIDKVDNLINMVGELVITQSMLGQLGTDFDVNRLPKLLEGLGQLEQNTRELQESVMRIRMLPISFVFSRFPRMVRDLSQTLNKEVFLEIMGETTELDKTVLEKIGDPLVHLVRNAVDHGIETVDQREAKNKPAEGCVRLNAYHQGGNVVIEVIDDGKGLDPESLKRKAIEKEVITESEAEQLTREQAFDLIFRPGFSTAKEISDVSGRGVGMDVVKRNIQALNGVIDITSEVDAGSKITIRLPLTLAILDGQLVRVTDQTYIFPIVSIVESMQCKSDFVSRVAGGSSVFRLRDEYVPILQLSEVFNIPVNDDNLDDALMVVVESDGEKVGIVVNELLAQQQVVIKSLEQNYRRVPGVSGATILGDGTVALIVDISGIVRLAGEQFSQHCVSTSEHNRQRTPLGLH